MSTLADNASIFRIECTLCGEEPPTTKAKRHDKRRLPMPWSGYFWMRQHLSLKHGVTERGLPVAKKTA